MSYKKATHVLPQDLLQKVQEYVDGIDMETLAKKYYLSLKSIPEQDLKKCKLKRGITLVFRSCGT